MNPDSIQVGWKLRIPNQDMANALHGQNAPQGLDKEALSNATYTGVMMSDDSYALQDRKFTEPAAPGTPLMTKVMLTDQIAYGDLNGAPSAAVIIVPVKFSVSYDASKIKLQNTCAVSARIKVNGQRNLYG